MVVDMKCATQLRNVSENQIETENRNAQTNGISDIRDAVQSDLAYWLLVDSSKLKASLKLTILHIDHLAWQTT